MAERHPAMMLDAYLAGENRGNGQFRNLQNNRPAHAFRKIRNIAGQGFGQTSGVGFA